MDGAKFDALVRTVTSVSSRRAAVASLLAGLVATWGTDNRSEAARRRQKRKAQRRGQRVADEKKKGKKKRRKGFYPQIDDTANFEIPSDGKCNLEIYKACSEWASEDRIKNSSLCGLNRPESRIEKCLDKLDKEAWRRLAQCAPFACFNGTECKNGVCCRPDQFGCDNGVCIVCPAPKTFYPDDCECRCVDQSCAPGTSLDPATCECRCPNGLILCDGACVERCDCVTHDDCDACQVCSNGQCMECPQSLPCCGDACLPSCEANAERDPESCQCTCLDGFKRCNDACIPDGDCCGNGDCSGGKTCQEGRCRCPGETKDCGGTCATCCASDDCGGDAWCCKGSCQDACGRGQDRDFLTCRCISICDTTGPPARALLQEGTCCVDASDCDDCEVCSDDHLCVPDPVGPSACDGVCTDFEVDDANCGGCVAEGAGQRCGACSECRGGTCQPKSGGGCGCGNPRLTCGFAQNCGANNASCWCRPGGGGSGGGSSCAGLVNRCGDCSTCNSNEVCVLTDCCAQTNKMACARKCLSL